MKLFLTAAHLFTILKQFGELSDEVSGESGPLEVWYRGRREWEWSYH